MSIAERLAAALRPAVSGTWIDRKLKLLGCFADILLAWRIWDFRATDCSTMQYAMFTVMRDIRGLDVEYLAKALYTHLTGVPRPLTATARNAEYAGSWGLGTRTAIRECAGRCPIDPGPDGIDRNQPGYADGVAARPPGRGVVLSELGTHV